MVSTLVTLVEDISTVTCVMDLRGFSVDDDDDYEAVMQYCIAFDLNNPVSES